MIEIEKKDKERLIGLIREVSEPKRVFLLAKMVMKRKTESIFAGEMPACHYTAHHFLLVLADENKETHEVQEQIEGRCKAVMTVTAIVIRADEFTGWLNEGHSFARRVVEKALLLYDKTDDPLFCEGKADAAAEAREMSAVFSNGMQKTDEFLAGADLYRARKEYGLATFMLHQAAECLLRTAVHAITGYYCHTHNLDKLVRYAGMVLWGVPEIFERWQPGKEALFQLLQAAYVGARYRKEYKVSLTEFEKLYSCVMRLQQHVKEVWVTRH